MFRGQLRRLAVGTPAVLVAGLLVAPTASAACGGSLVLGALNACGGTTSLSGSFNSSLFSITNTNTGASAGGLGVSANSAAAAVRGDNAGAGIGVRGTSTN